MHISTYDSVEAAAAVDTALLDDDTLLDHIAELERLVARTQSLQLAALADFARRPARVMRAGDDLAAVSATWSPIGRVTREFADDEVALHLRVSRQDAAARITTGCALTSLPATRAALAAGRIDLRRARVLVDETTSLDAAVAREVESALIARAERLPAARLRPLARRAAIDADPVAATLRERSAREDRRVVVTPTSDGMAELWAHLPAADATAIKTAISAAARASKAAAVAGDDRSMDQRMADALAAPFVEALASGELAGTGTRLATQHGRAAELQVLVSADTLLGRDDRAAELAGYGPITAEAARALAPDARWRRIVTDPTGEQVLDVGRTSYRPTAAIERHVLARSPRCTFPGCGWAAVACDLDHVVPFPEGPTSADNLHPLCRRHHRLKQAAGVAVERTETGALRWRMPTDLAEDAAHDSESDSGRGSESGDEPDHDGRGADPPTAGRHDP